VNFYFIDQIATKNKRIAILERQPTNRLFSIGKKVNEEQSFHLENKELSQSQDLLSPPHSASFSFTRSTLHTPIQNTMEDRHWL